ncbi:hypothetical protein GDO86_005248 [Hymenochirus boettgeri]|uniref:Uncharacterized protein n=1 Tax=Hymenochirus boettgeri TaxID=247094 RepID=A0A8T2J964_9PIPI|nr:hypothetical protein GDO86_005248 [Hymenochirus boettgeri]
MTAPRKCIICHSRITNTKPSWLIKSSFDWLFLLLDRETKCTCSLYKNYSKNVLPPPLKIQFRPLYDNESSMLGWFGLLHWNTKIK